MDGIYLNVFGYGVFCILFFGQSCTILRGKFELGEKERCCSLSILYPNRLEYQRDLANGSVQFDVPTLFRMSFTVSCCVLTPLTSDSGRIRLMLRYCRFDFSRLKICPILKSVGVIGLPEISNTLVE